MSAPLSQAAEDYLKAIYKLQEEASPVATNDLAAAMDVTPASATNMVKRLAKMDLVSHASYRGVVLTPSGEKVALEIIRHHRLLELYLREVMGYSWADLHREAEHLEHHISEDFEQRIDAMLGHPTHDPHGDPIPSQNGEIAPTSHAPLSRATPHVSYRIERLSDHDPALLHAFEALGLLPGTDVVVVRRTSDGGLVLRAEQEVHLSASDAAHIFVRDAG